MKFITWLGRTVLWFVFLPLGLWRSLRHGRRKAIKKALGEAQR